MYSSNFFLNLPFPVAIFFEEDAGLVYNKKWQNLFKIELKDKILLNNVQLNPFRKQLDELLKAKEICYKTKQSLTFNMKLNHLNENVDYCVIMFLIDKEN